MVAHVAGCKPNKISIVICDAHIYEEHIEAVKEQLNRRPYLFPKLLIKRTVDNIDNFISNDFKIMDYICHDKIAAKMIA